VWADRIADRISCPTQYLPVTAGHGKERLAARSRGPCSTLVMKGSGSSPGVGFLEGPANRGFWLRGATRGREKNLLVGRWWAGFVSPRRSSATKDFTFALVRSTMSITGDQHMPNRGVKLQRAATYPSHLGLRNRRVDDKRLTLGKNQQRSGFPKEPLEAFPPGRRHRRNQTSIQQRSGLIPAACASVREWSPRASQAADLSRQ
jgi:hypothetical protein